MNGAYNVSVPPNAVILEGLPIPAISAFYPSYNYSNQEVNGLLQVTLEGKLIAYSGNRNNIPQGVYEVMYLAQ